MCRRWCTEATEPTGCRIISTGPLLLVGAFDDALHAHAGLRRRALERLGCRVTAFNLIGTGGWLSRLRRVGAARPAGRAPSPAPRPRSCWCSRAPRWTPPWWPRYRQGRRRRLGQLVLRRAAARSEDIRPLAAGLRRRVRGRQRDRRGAGRAPAIRRVHYLPAGCDPSIHRPDARARPVPRQRGLRRHGHARTASACSPSWWSSAWRSGGRAGGGPSSATTAGASCSTTRTTSAPMPARRSR